MIFGGFEEARWEPTQIAITLIDDFTGHHPIGGVRVRLDALEAGAWAPTDKRPSITSRWVVTFPGLEKRSVPGPVPRRYRVRVDADHYLPMYPSPLTAGVEALVTPYNDDMPPPVPSAPQDLLLLPAVTYPFPAHVRVLRGRARELGTSGYVAGAVVRQGTRERVVTDHEGGFALPLRWPAMNAAALPIDVDHPVSGNTTTVTIGLPAALGQGLTIDIS
jgi:hypothetical protein